MLVPYKTTKIVKKNKEYGNKLQNNRDKNCLGSSYAMLSVLKSFSFKIWKRAKSNCWEKCCNNVSREQEVKTCYKLFSLLFPPSVPISIKKHNFCFFFDKLWMIDIKTNRNKNPYTSIHMYKYIRVWKKKKRKQIDLTYISRFKGL